MNILNGIKVIELSSVLAGPSVGQFLAECGAEVIKIENFSTGGDVTRSWKLSTENIENDISAYFSCANWGKKSICLDLPKENEKLYELVKGADIVLASYKPGDGEKLKADYVHLATINPQIIYAHITGYGNDTNLVGYDAIIQAEAGFTYMNGEKKGNSVKMPVALVDLLAAHQLKEAILLAYIRKLKTGQGAYLHVSLFESAVCALANQATNWLVAGHIPAKMGNEHPNIVPYGNIFKTKDGSVVLAVGNDKQFALLCYHLEMPLLAQNEKFITNAERVKNREELIKTLEIAFENVETNHIIEKLQKANVPIGKIRNMKEVFEEQLAQNLVLKADKNAGLRQIAFSINDEFLCNISPPPHLGEH